MRYLELIQHEHAQMYHAIARRDAEAARAAVRLHLTNSRERLRATLERSTAARAKPAGKPICGRRVAAVADFGRADAWHVCKGIRWQPRLPSGERSAESVLR